MSKPKNDAVHFDGRERKGVPQGMLEVVRKKDIGEEKIGCRYRKKGKTNHIRGVCSIIRTPEEESKGQGFLSKKFEGVGGGGGTTFGL